WLRAPWPIFPLTIFRNVLYLSLCKITPPIRRRRFCLCPRCTFRTNNVGPFLHPQFLHLAGKSFGMLSSEHPKLCTILVQISPLDYALTDTAAVTPLESALTKKGGEGRGSRRDTCRPCRTHLV